MDSITIAPAALWSCAALVIYTYIGYPILIGAIGRWFGKGAGVAGGSIQPACRADASVSVILAAYNEEATISRRLPELAALVGGVGGEVILVSDGSTDRTAEVARGCELGVLRVIELPSNVGKAGALWAGCAAARNEIIAFADARQTWAPDALGLLLENFRDSSVGAVSGDLVLESREGTVAGVGLYWRYEKWLRKRESLVHSTVGVTGAICAVRKELFPPIPRGTILDDVYWPLVVVMQGYRAIHDGRAHAFDRLPDRAIDEFRRKVRTLSGNYQLLARLPSAILPWHNPIWFQFFSHKILRLLVPWALMAMLIICAWEPGAHYRVALLIQAAFYIVGLAGILSPVAVSRFRAASAAASFIILNAAAWLAFWVWVSGTAARSWAKVSYPETAVSERAMDPTDVVPFECKIGQPEPVSPRRRALD